MKEMLQKGKGIRSILGAVFCLMMCLAVMPALTAHAEEVTPEVNITKDGILEWTLVPGADYYEIGVEVNRNGSFRFKSGPGPCDINNFLVGGHSYDFTVQAMWSGDIPIGGIGSAHIDVPGELYPAPIIVPDPENPAGGCKWNAIPGATQYTAYLCYPDGRLVGPQVQAHPGLEAINLAQFHIRRSSSDECEYRIMVGAYCMFLGNTVAPDGYSDVVVARKLKVNYSADKKSGDGQYFPGSRVELAAGKRQGYVFEGWTISGITLPKLEAEKIIFDMPDNDIEATANWRTGWYISFDSDGGNLYSEYNTIATQADYTLEFLPTPTKVGYEFIGWYCQRGRQAGGNH